MSIAALKAGKHVMCTVPMATTIEECRQIVELVKKTGLKYMMAETVVYSREFLFIKEMYEKGELGKIQHLAASHPQDMDGWPDYWERMIPMHYATHVVSPCLGLVDGRRRVRELLRLRHRARRHREEVGQQVRRRDLPHQDQGLATSTAHIWRFLYDVARQYRESFDVYGTKQSFEWTLVEHEPHVIHTAKKPEPEIPEKVTMPDFAHLLPEPIRKFTLPQQIHDAEHLSFIQGGGHGGSHPHLVNEMVTALVEDRDPWPNAVTIGQLDLRRHLCSRIGAEGRRDRAIAGVYAWPESPRLRARFRSSNSGMAPVVAITIMPNESYASMSVKTALAVR